MSDKISIRNTRRTLSDKETKLLAELEYQNKTIFTRDDAKKIVGEPTVTLNRLVKKKFILKIRREVYVIVPWKAGPEGSDRYTLHSFVIGSLLTKPYYIGYWSALNYYGFTEQTPPRVYIATDKPRNNKKILNVEYRFVTISSHKMFEIETKTIDNNSINISSPEKTFIDCLDHPEHAGGIEEVAKAFYFSHDEIDLKKLCKLAGEIQNTAVTKRLGYISEIFELDTVLANLNTEISDQYASLEPFSKKKGKIVERWMLKINADINPERWT